MLAAPQSAESGYLAPRQVIVGPGTSRAAGEALRSWGVGPGPPVVIADRVVSEARLVGQVVAGLQEAGFAPRLFAETAGEPDDALTSRASDLGRSLAAVSVVGVGGGSALDGAKAGYAVYSLGNSSRSVCRWGCTLGRRQQAVALSNDGKGVEHLDVETP
jgi:alcohol dehydrogenase class IV